MRQPAWFHAAIDLLQIALRRRAADETRPSFGRAPAQYAPTVLMPVVEKVRDVLVRKPLVGLQRTKLSIRDGRSYLANPRDSGFQQCSETPRCGHRLIDLQEIR